MKDVRDLQTNLKTRNVKILEIKVVIYKLIDLNCC